MDDKGSDAIAELLIRYYRERPAELAALRDSFSAFGAAFLEATRSLREASRPMRAAKREHRTKGGPRHDHP